MEDRLPSDVVAERFRDERRRQGLSTRSVAERCAELGAPQLTAPVLMNIENGRRDESGRRRRDVSVDELLTLAYALEISPLALLLGPDDEAYAVTPELLTTAARVFEWLVGERLPPLPGPDAKDTVTDEDRARAWLLLVQALPYVQSEVSARWPVRNELERLREYRDQLDYGRAGDLERRIVAAILPALRAEIRAAIENGE